MIASVRCFTLFALSFAVARLCDPREVPLADIKASLSKIGHIVPVTDS